MHVGVCVKFIYETVVHMCVSVCMGFPGGTAGEEPACQCRRKGDEGSIPGSGGSPEGEGMPTHPSILAWKIPWTGELGRLQPMRSQRVGDD